MNVKINFEGIDFSKYLNMNTVMNEDLPTNDPIEKAYFGCGGVAEIPDLQNKLIRLARGGFKHHTTVGMGHMKAVLEEAFGTYRGYEIIDIDN